MSRTVPIAEIAEVNPRIPAELSGDRDREVNFVPMSHVSESGVVSINGTRTLREVSKGYTYFANGDVLVAKITPCMENGKAAYVSTLPAGVGFGSTEFHVLRPTEDVDGRYLFYMVWNPLFREEASRNMTGSAGQKRVPASFFERFEIPLPSLSQQRRIADILDKADGIRRSRREARNTTSEMSMSAFRETFRDYLTPDAAELILSDVAEVVSGVAKGRKLDGAETREVPYLRVANVQSGYLDLSEIKTIPAKESEVRELALQRGDVVMTEGGDHDKLGRGALWEHDVADCIHQNHVFRVRTNRKKLFPTFFVHYLQTQLAKNYFLRCAKKTTNLASINMTQLRALPVSQPPLKLQDRFDRELRTIREVIDRQDTAQKDADCLFNSLVHRAFRGEL
jgi:type I restriction enzyme S subunit